MITVSAGHLAHALPFRETRPRKSHASAAVFACPVDAVCLRRSRSATGWLYDEKAPQQRGQKFDSSLDRGQPFTFKLGAGQVIRGWDEGVAGMKVGGKRTLLIPAWLGYGSSGAGGVIPPNASLVFEVELLGVTGH